MTERQTGGRGYGGFDRRREDPDLARWRGDIEARVRTLETELARVAAVQGEIRLSMARMEGDVAVIRRDLVTTRDDIRAAAAEIDHGREESVRDLKNTIADQAERVRSGSLTRWQLAGALFIAIVGPAVASLITVALTGGH